MCSLCACFVLLLGNLADKGISAEKAVKIINNRVTMRCSSVFYRVVIKVIAQTRCLGLIRGPTELVANLIRECTRILLERQLIRTNLIKDPDVGISFVTVEASALLRKYNIFDI